MILSKVYEDAERRLERNEITIGEFERLVDIEVIVPKRGEWIETSEGTMCSNCYKFPYDDGEYHIANWYSDFCPHCGTRMKTVENKRDYERAIEQMQYDMLYESTYNPEDGSM